MKDLLMASMTQVVIEILIYWSWLTVPFYKLYTWIELLFYRRVLCPIHIIIEHIIWNYVMFLKRGLHVIWKCIRYTEKNSMYRLETSVQFRVTVHTETLKFYTCIFYVLLNFNNSRCVAPPKSVVIPLFIRLSPCHLEFWHVIINIYAVRSDLRFS